MASALTLGLVVAVAPAVSAATPTVVSLTFDDSDADQMTALSTMQSFGLHGTFYAISGSIGSPSYLTLADLHTIYDAGNEIGGHTVNHPDLTLESTDEVQRQVCGARNQLEAWGFPQTSFAYPYATVNPAVEAVVAQCGYNSGRSLGDVVTQLGGEAGLYGETMPPADPYALRVPDEIDATWTLADLQNTVTNAEASGGGWVVLTFHHICDPGPVICDPSVSITPALFAQFSEWLANHVAATPTTSVQTVSQVIGGPDKPLVTPPAPPTVSGAMTNSSLETAITPGVPKCWSAYSFGTNTPTWAEDVDPIDGTVGETTNAHTGRVAETITMTNYTDGDAKIMPTFDTGECTPSAIPGHSYQLGGWYKSTVPTQFEVYYRNATGGFQYWDASPWLPASATYTQALWTTQPLPAGASGISFGLTIFSNGTITTDDYSYIDSTPTAPVFTAASPPLTATVGTAYSYTYAATGVPAPTYAVASGALPTGLTLNATTGVLSGTPTTVGAYTFTVAAANTVSPDATSPSTTITVAPAPAPPVFTAASPPLTATVGTAYSYTYAATGVPAPTYAVASGALPTGLTLNATTGVLSGTPTTAAAFTFTIRASNGVGTPAVSASTRITVALAMTAPVFTAASPPLTATVGTNYSYTYIATGNPKPTYALASGSLPTGLTLNATTGVLSGRPTTAGSFTFTVRASNGVGTPPVTPSTRITVAARTAPVFTAVSPPLTATVGTAYSYTFAARANPAATFAVMGALPTGLALNATTGLLSGRPTRAGTFTFMVIASNGVGLPALSSIKRIVVR